MSSKAFHVIKPKENEIRLFWQADDLRDKLYPEVFEELPGTEEKVAEIISTPSFDIEAVPHYLRLVVTAKGRVLLQLSSDEESPKGMLCRFGFIAKLATDIKIEGVRKIAAQTGCREIWDMGKRMFFSRQIRDHYPKGKHHLRIFILMELFEEEVA